MKIRPKGPLSLEDKILLGIAVVLIVMLMFWLTGCTSMHNRQAKFRYEYITRCILDVQGSEQMTGDEIAAGADLAGPDCTVSRKATTTTNKNK